MRAISSIVLTLAVLLPLAPCRADDQAPVDLQVAVFPYLPDAEAAIERLEESFEAHASEQGTPVDLDLVLLDTYGEDLAKVTQFDVAEIDLCVLERLLTDGARLEALPELDTRTPRQWIGPAAAAMEGEHAHYVLPHWVCGNFLLHWSTDERLEKAKGFEQLLEAVNPDMGRLVFADLWGTSTLGEFYADAVLDQRGPDEARQHFIMLGESPAAEAKNRLCPDAVEALRRLTLEMQPEHLAAREELHDVAHVYPRAFATEIDSLLVGYSERLYHVERRLQEEPWQQATLPVPADQLTVRQFPFAGESRGTPTWCDAFIVPAGKLPPKRHAIELFLQFVVSEDGYRCFLEPRPYAPGAYLLPATAEAYETEFVKTHLPVLVEYRTQLDASFPVLDYQVYEGIKAAGKALKDVLAR